RPKPTRFTGVLTPACMPPPPVAAQNPHEYADWQLAVVSAGRRATRIAASPLQTARRARDAIMRRSWDASLGPMTDDRRDGSPLSGLTAGTLDYVLETRLGLHGYFISGQVRPVTSATRFCGRARTLRTLPMRPDIVEAQRD